MADRTIEIIVDVTDKTGGKVKGLQNQLKELDRTAQRLANRFKSFSTMKYRAAIELIDRVTEPGNRINNLLRRLAGKAWRLSLSVTDSALGKLRQVESLLMRIASKTYNIAINVKDNVKGKLGGLLNGAAMGAGMFMPMAGAMGVGFGVANAVQAYAGFEQQMSKVQAIRQLDKNSDEMKRLTQQAKDLGASTAWTRQQVGEAQYYQALAGWSTENILKATPHLLNLASASGMDLGRASDIVTDTMTAFNLKPTDTYTNNQGKEVNAAEHYMDLLAKLQASSNTTIEQAAGALKYSANQVGALTMNLTGKERVQAAMENATDAAVMTALLANAGIKDSMAGTGMSNIMQRMTSGNRNAYYGLGLTDTEIEDAGHNLLPFEKIIKQLNKSFHEGLDVDRLANFVEEMSGQKIHADTRRRLDKISHDVLENGGKMGTANAQQLATMLGGAEHAHKLLALIMGDWDAMEKKLTDVNGTAKEMADTMLDNLAGSFTILGSAWDAFQQSFLEGQAGEGLRSFVDTLTEIISRATKLFSDGIDIGDFGKIIGDVIGRLKNKFLELDGVGSLLAGGALVAGLMKIVSLSQRALNGIRNIGKANIASAATGGISAAQKVGTMHVSAGVVNVNGRVNGGGVGANGRRVGNTAIIDNYNATKERIRNGGGVPPVASRFSGFGSAAASGAAFAGIFGLMDVFNLKAMNADRLAAATSETERAQIIKENRQAEWEAGVGVTGSVLGAAIGAGLGSFVGPLGTAIGGMLGEYFGAKAGKANAENEQTPTTRGWGHREEGWDGIKLGDSARRRADDIYESEHRAWEGIQLGSSARRRALDQMEQETKSVLAFRKNFDEDMKAHMGTTFFDTAFNRNNDATQDYYQQRATDMAANRNEFFQNPLDVLGSIVDGFLFNKSEAAELTPEQMATEGQIRMPEIEMPETSPLEEWLNFDGVTERLAELGSLITEGLSSAFEGAGEILSGFGESIMEGLSGIGEGAGEIFSGLGEMISSGMEAAHSAATGALEGIQSAFMSAKDSICSAWGELPGFFGGIFDGLGGIAAAAGSAIYSGLTSVIGAIVGAWEGAASTIGGIISSIASMGSSVSATVSGVIASVTGHAEGGFITSPEFALIGEKGAELILPLTDRERSLELLNQASGILGLDEGLAANSFVSQGGTSGGESLSVGGVTVNATFEINGSDNPQEIMQTIQANLESLTDKVAAKFAVDIQDCFRNQTLAP